MKLNEFITKELVLTGIPDDVAKIAAKQEELNRVNLQLQNIKNEVEKKLFREWQSAIAAACPGCKPLTSGYFLAGMTIPVGDINLKLTVYVYNDKLCCQLDNFLSGQNIPDYVIAKVKHILPEEKGGIKEMWRYFPRYSYDEACVCLTNVVQTLRK